MTTSEIIHDLNEMPVDNMGAAEGVIVSHAIWEYTALKDGNPDRQELGKAIVDKAGQMKDKVGAVSGCEYPSAMNLLYTAYNITGDDGYKNVITELEKSQEYMGLAFDMNYETAFGGKEHYHAITVEFAKVKDNERDDEMQEALFMLSLADTIAAIAQPVYELYRSLVDMFRDELKNLVSAAWQREGKIPAGVGAERVNIFADVEAQKVISLALRKACAMRVVLSEKYANYIND